MTIELKIYNFSKILENIILFINQKGERKIRCKRCGKCCTYVAVRVGPLTKDSVMYYKHHNISYKRGWIRLPLACKYFNEKTKECLVYDYRPEACKRYHCKLHKDPFMK